LRFLSMVVGAIIASKLLKESFEDFPKIFLDVLNLISYLSAMWT
jgi:hypothetical protein